MADHEFKLNRSTYLNNSEMIPGDSLNTTGFEERVPFNVRIWYIVGYILLGLLIITGNGLFLITYFRRKNKSFRTNATYFLVHLAFADLFVGFNMIYHIVLARFPELERVYTLCTIRYVSVLFPLTASVTLLMTISVDRFLLIRRPLQYRMLMTRHRAHVTAAMVWMTSALLAIVAPLVSLNPQEDAMQHVCELTVQFKWELFAYLAVPVLTLFTVVLAVIYILITAMIVRHRKEIVNLTSGTTPTSQNSKRFIRQEVKIAITGMIVVGVFYACFLPSFVILCIQTYTFQMDDRGLNRARTISTFSAMCNSAMNAFIYAWRMPNFRESVKELICFRKFLDRKNSVTKSTLMRRDSNTLDLRI